MPDDVDIASAVAEAFNAKARAERQRAQALPPKGCCYECGLEFVPGSRLLWCSTPCRVNYEAAVEAERRRTMANGRGE